MHERFTSGLYWPELVKIMSEAFDLALAHFELPTRAAKKLLADAIIEGVDAGEREPAALADRATNALRRAIEGGLASE